MKLSGNTATLVLSNVFSITIKVSDDGENVQYQYNGGNDDKIYSAEIEYLQDDENDDDDDFCPAFRTEEGTVYHISEFMRDNF